MIKKISGSIYNPYYYDDDGVDVEEGGVFINGIQLAESLVENFQGKMVYARLAYAKTPISDELFLEIADQLEGIFEGHSEYHRGYSEYTPGYYDEYGNIGGHKLLDVMASYEGDYVYLLIADEPIPDLAEALSKAESL